METNFSVLTAVHAANALVGRERLNGEETELDLFYLLTIHKKDEITKWMEIYHRSQSETLNYV